MGGWAQAALLQSKTTLGVTANGITSSTSALASMSGVVGEYHIDLVRSQALSLHRFYCRFVAFDVCGCAGGATDGTLAHLQPGLPQGGAVPNVSEIGNFAVKRDGWYK